MITNADIFGALSRVKAELNEVIDTKDESLRKHLFAIWDVCHLIQDLIEAKDVTKATEPK